jgi:hypothetical protein
MASSTAAILDRMKIKDPQVHGGRIGLRARTVDTQKENKQRHTELQEQVSTLLTQRNAS